MFGLADLEIAYMKPKRISTVIDWLQHTPFAFTIVKFHAPEILVELGTRTGVSYCAFCQAVQCLGLSTKCYAVDTWKGDEHAGYYSEDVFTEFSDYHNRTYKAFSTLLRTTFDDALAYFSDNSIDLLHIDGLHFYEAVKHDFESWLPKMSSRGMVLFHDTNIRSNDYGVWRLFEELKTQYPTFEFSHGFGLGMVAVGSKEYDDRISWLLQVSPQESTYLRAFFASLGTSIETDHQLSEQSHQLAERDRQLAEQSRQLAERDRQLAEQSRQLAERDRQIAEQSHQLAERDRQLAEQSRQLAERDHQLAKQIRQLAEFHSLIETKDREIKRVLESLSWRLTRPLRFVRGLWR